MEKQFYENEQVIAQLGVPTTIFALIRSNEFSCECPKLREKNLIGAFQQTPNHACSMLPPKSSTEPEKRNRGLERHPLSPPFPGKKKKQS
jgi:hypothetical protein